MTRLLYAASPADYFINSDGSPNPAATATAWTTRTGSTQVTDMLDASGAAATVVSADSLGGFRFSGPDAYTGSIWVQGAGGTRYEVKPTGLAERVAALEVALAQELVDRAAADSAALDTASNDAADQIQAHVDLPNPHTQYVVIVDGNDDPILAVTIHRLRGTDAFPPAADLPDDDLMVYGG